MHAEKYLRAIMAIGILIVFVGFGLECVFPYAIASELGPLVREASDDAQAREIITEYLFIGAPARIVFKVLVGLSIVVLALLCERECRKT